MFHLFKFSELDEISTEVNSIYQAGFLGFLVGAGYGGFIYSRNAYENFMHNNQATAFESHLDAKKKLQDKVTINFAKGAFKWGWRVALFSSSYVCITTMISVYRGKSSLLEYVTAGAVTGGIYKVNLGLRGIIVGNGLGATLGGIAGGLSLLILRSSGMTMEEVRYWQYKWKDERSKSVREAYIKETKNEADKFMELHNQSIENKISLDNLEVPSKNEK